MVNDRVLEDRVDEALEETFPASDAPWFMAAAAVVGAPRRSESAERPEVHEVSAIPARGRRRAKPGPATET